MALDLNEDKDLNEKISDFFSRNKKNIILYSLIFIAFYFASTIYISQGEKKQIIASDLYQKVQMTKQLSEAEILTNELKTTYSNTAYASRASIFLGNLYSKSHSNDEAKKNYNWAIDNAIEPTIKSLAQYQLSLLLYTLEDYDNALKVAIEIRESGFTGLKNYLIGDTYLKMGNKSEALRHFNVALNFYKDKNDLAKVIKIKVDSIS